MALNALVDSFLPQLDEKSGTERVNCIAYTYRPIRFKPAQASVTFSVRFDVLHNFRGSKFTPNNTPLRTSYIDVQRLHSQTQQWIDRVLDNCIQQISDSSQSASANVLSHVISGPLVSERVAVCRLISGPSVEHQTAAECLASRPSPGRQRPSASHIIYGRHNPRIHRKTVPPEHQCMQIALLGFRRVFYYRPVCSPEPRLWISD